MGIENSARNPSAENVRRQRGRGIMLLLGLLLGVAGGWWLGWHVPAETPAAAQAKQLYTCGMHPQVIQDHPGNCPICGMKLTAIKRTQGAVSASAGPGKIKYYKSTMMPGEVRQTPGKDSMGMMMVPVYEEQGSAEPAAIEIDPVTVQNMNLRVETVREGPLRRVIRTVAVIDFDETRVAEVTTKFAGWIEKMYVDATGQEVHRGNPLFDIYSPELYAAQVEYIATLSAPAGEPSGMDTLSASSRQKLAYWDLTDAQIGELETTRQPQKTRKVFAPIDGFVIEKKIVEGQMVPAGTQLYRLADLSLVWVQAEIYEQDLAYLRLGQEATVTLDYLPDRQFRGRVTYIYPTLDTKTRTARVRMEFHNPGFFLKPGMYATAEVTAELAPSALLVPDSAVLRSGSQNTVFVALPGGHFEPRIVTLGVRAADDQYQVVRGLRAGDRVVTSGQFMLDSESQLREAIQKMLKPGQAGAVDSPVAATSAPATEPGATNVVYVCPMPEHVSIEYSHAGVCPLCGMTLVPVTRAALEKMQPDGVVEYYTCPMPEHSDVHLDRPGKCPRCGMTLIPVMTRAGRAAGPERSSAASPLVLYTCPMPEHADIVSDRPGKCPKCGMELVQTGTVKHGRTAEAHWREMHPARAP